MGLLTGIAVYVGPGSLLTTARQSGQYDRCSVQIGLSQAVFALYHEVQNVDTSRKRPMSIQIHTERLLLRQWQEHDRRVFSAMNKHPQVMRYFPRYYTDAESNAFIDANVRRIADGEAGAWAVEVIASGEFIGFVGFSQPAEWHPCAGKIDIGWRLHQQHWGLGYATEAARSALKAGFESYALSGVVSFTAQCNLASIAVMKKIGLHRSPQGFEHPRIDAGSPLCAHVLYQLTREAWQSVS